MQEIHHSLPIEVEVLTPVHIGSGAPDLVADYDFAFAKRQVWVIDQEKMLAALDEKRVAGLIDAKISRLLDNNPSKYAQCARYTMVVPGTLAPQEIRQCMKDADGRPYLPGSSLKGAIRTALATASATTLNEGIDAVIAAGRKVNKKEAARGVEKRLFGSDPNDDLLRALAITDCASESRKIELYSVRLLTLNGGRLVDKGPAFRFFVEAMPAGTKLRGAISLDRHLLSLQTARISFASKRQILDNFAASCRALAIKLLKLETEFYSQAGQGPAQRECRRLCDMGESLKEGEFLLQVGWGAGWLSKTLGPKIDRGRLRRLVDQFNLDRGRKAPIFPKTRRLVEINGQPVAPLGWIKVSVGG